MDNNSVLDIIIATPHTLPQAAAPDNGPSPVSPPCPDLQKAVTVINCTVARYRHLHNNLVTQPATQLYCSTHAAGDSTHTPLK